MKKERVFYILMTFLVALVIFLSSSIEIPYVESTGINLSWVYHFGVFFMFTFFLTLSIRNKKLDTNTLLLVILISLTYAISDEVHQLFVPGRFASLKDILIDLTGSLFSVLLIWTIERFRRL